MTTQSVWAVRPGLPKFSKLKQDIKVDVVVVGGGITGVTAAYLLVKEGFKVALVERYRCGAIDTGHTTAHLTYVTDERLHKLVQNFGKDQARAVWEAGRTAIERIEQIVKKEKIDCEFQWVPGYLHAPLLDGNRHDEEGLRRDCDLAVELGFGADFVEEAPFVKRPAVQFENQAKFHPLRYLAGLLKALPEGKCQVFENTHVTEITDHPMTVKANGKTIECSAVVIATHVPLMGHAGIASATVFQAKLAPYSSYAVGAKVKKGIVPEALFWDTNDPYNYLRVERRPRFDYVIFGGQDHKTGQEEDTEARFEKLESLLAEYLPEAKVERRWSGQAIETTDGLPYIGETARRQFVATGFSGNGMTFGTLGAMMACDDFAGRENPWQELFSVRRTGVTGTVEYIKGNKDYPYYMVRDRLTSAEDDSLENLQPGQAMIVNLNGEKAAAYCNPAGEIAVCSAKCTHMGCFVHWNAAETSWDCPCHGSRFHPTGEVIAGPAETPLAPITAAATK